MNVARIQVDGVWKDGIFFAAEPLQEKVGDIGGEIDLQCGLYPNPTNFQMIPSRYIHIGTNPVRIGFVAKMRSGKDTAADHLVRHCGGAVMKFATPMYEIHDFAVKRLGLVGKQRRLLQLIGTEWGRQTLGEDFWVDQLQKDLVNYPGSVYVTDCRFPNEAERLRRLGFCMVRVIRPDQERVKAGATSEEHESERYIEQIETDFTLVNDGTMPEFLKKVDELALKVSYMGRR